MPTRRQFVQQSSATLLCGAAALRVKPLRAQALHLPLGIQLYSVREQLQKDFDATLAQVAGVGFREVEAAGFFNHSAADVKAAMDRNGLRCVSSHVGFPALRDTLDEVIAFHHTIASEAIICPSTGPRQPSATPNSMTLDDWRWNAEQFNLFATKVNAAGMRFGYHNHVREFTPVAGVVPYDELLRLTDPARVTFELDCGWAVVAQASPVEYFRRYPGRFSMLHVKDFKLTPGSAPGTGDKVTELGQGSIDYAPILRQAALSQQIRHIFVEQEAFDMPWVESLKVDASYMRNLKA